MKKARLMAVLFPALAALPTAALAQALDFTPDTGRILSDPAFLPYAGQFYGVTGYNFIDLRGQTFDSTGAGQSTSHQWAQQFSQSLAYGLTDDLSVNASVAYDPLRETKQEFQGGGVAKASASGFADPFFGAAWRAIDQAAAPVNFDLFASYSPDWIGAHSATADEDATVARGGQAGEAGAALSHVTNGFTIYGSFLADILGQRNVDNPATGAAVQTGSRTDYTLALQTQTRFAPGFSFDAGVAQVWNGNASAFNTATGVSHLNEPGDNTDVNLGLDYQVVPNTFVASLTYAHDFPQDIRNVFPPGANDGGAALRRREGNVYGGKLSYAVP